MKSKIKLSIIQQGRIKAVKLRMREAESKGEKLDMSQLLEILLPKYDQDANHNGKIYDLSGTLVSEGNAKVREFHKATQFHKGIKGGVRSGKTYTLMAEAIGLSFLNRPYFHFSLSPSFDNAIKTVVEVLEELCKQNNLAYDWQVSKSTFFYLLGY